MIGPMVHRWDASSWMSSQHKLGWCSGRRRQRRVQSVHFCRFQLTRPQPIWTHQASCRNSVKQQRADLLKSALNDLRPFFHLRIEDASKKLGVGLTVLKRRCRQLGEATSNLMNGLESSCAGVSRWPYRLIKCVDKLINYLKVSCYSTGRSDGAMQTDGTVDCVEVKERIKQLRQYKEVVLRGRSIELPGWAKRAQQQLSKLKYRVCSMGRNDMTMPCLLFRQSSLRRMIVPILKYLPWMSNNDARMKSLFQAFPFRSNNPFMKMWRWKRSK